MHLRWCNVLCIKNMLFVISGQREYASNFQLCTLWIGMAHLQICRKHRDSWTLWRNFFPIFVRNWKIPRLSDAIGKNFWRTHMCGHSALLEKFNFLKNLKLLAKNHIERDSVMRFLSVGFFIKNLLLVPLEVPWDNFVFCWWFTEIMDKKLAQRCMVLRGTVTRRCILQRGMTTWWCILHPGFNTQK